MMDGGRSLGALVAVVVAGVSAVAGCHRTPATAGPDDAQAEAPAPSAQKPAILPARCKATDVAFPLDDGRALDELEIGDAIAYGGGIAVEVVHKTAAGRVGAVALLPPDASAVRVRDLGPTLGDAPPPRLTARGADLVAASYVLGKKTDTREIDLVAISAAGDVRPAGVITEQRDDSLAFDVAAAVVAWDEASPSSHRGVIKAAELTADGHVGATHDASPPESDAEAPRLVAFGPGYLLFWIARRMDPATLLDAAGAIEVTSEVAAPAWIEAVALDAHGQTAGAVRRLTASSGHVSGFDLAQSGQAGRPEVLLVARDDGEATDGSGGTILRLRVRADGQDPPLAYATDGLGRGAPSVVDATPPWLAWVDPREETRLLPLDETGTPIAPPSAEPELDEGRPLLLVGPAGAPGAAASRRLLAAMPADAAGQLRMFTCTP
jgi:hypothetical protein